MLEPEPWTKHLVTSDLRLIPLSFLFRTFRFGRFLFGFPVIKAVPPTPRGVVFFQVLAVSAITKCATVEYNEWQLNRKQGPERDQLEDEDKITYGITL